MSDRIDDDREALGENERLWKQLEQLSQAEPDPKLRQRVLNDIHQHGAAKPAWWQTFLPAEPRQWLSMAAATVAGIAIGVLMNRGEADLGQRMTQLESQLVAVNQQLLMSRLTATAPSERLAAALQAGTLAQRDPAVAAALVQRAAIDTVPSVRSAAIGALGDEINEEGVSAQLLAVLSANDSPIVQMAVIDLILRHGNDALLAALKQRLATGDIHPSLAGYLEDTMGGLTT